MPKICMLGSLNIDMTIFVPHFNQPGESLTGTDLKIFTGGKGGNQSIACARLGADVQMIGCLGSDAGGGMYRGVLEKEGIDTKFVATAENVASGTAFIEVVPSGENRIAVAQGANDVLNPEIVRAGEEAIAACDVYMSQLENPMDAIMEGLRLAKKYSRTVVLDPAPARPLPDEIFALCDYLTPNETELEIITGMPVDTVEQAITAARTLIAKGAKAVINKRGAAGSLLITADDARMFPGFTVRAVDTTAAGDSFNAGFSIGIARGYAIEDAIKLGNAVGALSTTKSGAQAAMPTQAEVDAFLAG